MGTPEFAASVLGEIVESSSIEIVGVITAPDKQAGRGRKVRFSEVKVLAESYSLQILQPTNLKDPEFISELEKLKADLFVVVAFRMLPEVVWSMPSKGTINLHASLLPNYRGAAPINWAIINGETETGVTTFFIEREIDTGEIIEQERVSIGPNETVGQLYIRLMNIGAKLTLSSILKIKAEENESMPQIVQNSFKNIRLAPKIFKNDCYIPFDRTSDQVHNFCRGLSPYPGAWFKLIDNETKTTRTIKVFKTAPTTDPIRKLNKVYVYQKRIFIPCKKHYLEIIELQLEGKRRMSVVDFLAGNSLEDHSILSKQVNKTL